MCNPVVLSQGNCSPRCCLAMTIDIFCCHSLGWGRRGAPGLWWMDARGAAKHPTECRQPHTVKNDPVQNIRGAEAEKPGTAYHLDLALSTQEATRTCS